MVNVPDLPPPHGSTPGPERPWRWQLEGSDGQPETVGGEYDVRFLNQADAESWIGEIWAELADAGIEAVTLLEGDRVVYGPMSLRA